MTFLPTSNERYLNIILALAQYPILGTHIRAHMREELFERNIILPQELEAEAHRTAIQTQKREGLDNPTSEEPTDVWNTRLTRVRDHLTDLYFSHHLPFEEFEVIANEVLEQRGVKISDVMLSINPELAPTELVFEQALTIENMSPDMRKPYEPRLRELKVVLIRTLISDQLPYINIAKEWFKVSDLADIRRRRIGAGRVGGKAAGMLLANRILADVDNEILGDCMQPIESFFIGSDEMYNFMTINNLVDWNDQKYKTEEDMRHDYPDVVQDFEAGLFPPSIEARLQGLLNHIGHKPMIVRSSSLLEDNFGTAFAGKYDSIFLPNQGALEENLDELNKAVARVYASTFNPNALLYRRSRGLQDYDERMAIIIQVVEGNQYDHYFFPHAAGVAFSRNFYRWSPQIRKEDGFVRLVCGLGTRAVDRVANDYPRLIPLSHPNLRPTNNPQEIRRYSQRFIDLIDLNDNEFKTVPIEDVLSQEFPALRYIAQQDEDGYLAPIRSILQAADNTNLVVTFDELIRRTNFANQMKEVLNILEEYYRLPVDVEFTMHLDLQNKRKPKVKITLLQCRPLSILLGDQQATFPKNIKEEDTVFTTSFIVPQGVINRVDYVVFIPPSKYFSLKSMDQRNLLFRSIGKLNSMMENEHFVCVGPGRWGSSNSDLGVSIDYGDIYNTKALIELTGPGIGPVPEPSLGTHFFQDLLEAHIYPLAVCLDNEDTIFNESFFYRSKNRIYEFLEVVDEIKDCLHLIRVTDHKKNVTMRIIMDDERGEAIAYFVPKNVYS